MPKSLTTLFLALLACCCFAQGPNLARQAKASASETQETLTADKAIDGDENSRWSGIPGHNSGVWYELDWTAPVTVGEVVLKQYDRYLMEFDLQTWDAATKAWVTKGHFGKPNEHETKIILCRITPTQTTKLRIANITNGPSFTEVEVYSNPLEHPITLAMASDLQGNFVGMVTDTLGASPAEGREVTLTGTSPNGQWEGKAKADAHGMFFVTMPVGMNGPIHAKVIDGPAADYDSQDFQYGLTPLDSKLDPLNLNGKWKFHIDPPATFANTEFDDTNWSDIDVPAHWEMQGFRSLSGIGGYRRTFERPKGDGRLKIRFDGVYNGAEVYVNGKLVATHEGGFTPFEADITDICIAGKNVVALKVREHTNVSDNMDKMSQYADFPLGGIIRKATTYWVPEVHVAAYQLSTKLNPDGSALVSGTVSVVNESGTPVDGSAEMSLVGHESSAYAVPRPAAFSVKAWDRAEIPFSITVQKPQLWNAEHPNLYTLHVELKKADKTIQSLTQETGLRETRIEGTKILINGSPVKFRGTCHHDTHPTMGRAVTPELEKQDLTLIKAANLNSVRTSHYPPLPELIQYADEMGVYVEDEADFCWVGVSNDLRNTPRIIQLTAEMIARDRNHPSVFEWSLCNESEFGYGFERSHEWVRSIDPSRPNSAATSAWLEIATLHNPLAINRIKENENIDKPLLFDESLCIYQGIFNDVAEMWVDPGIRDYYVEPQQEIYKTFMESNTTQGSMIWCWADDIFCVPGRGMEYGRDTTKSHFIETQYRLPGRGLVGDAPWGVVDSWRRPKPEFWITKKLHSPVKIEEKPLALPAAGQALHVPVENQYDFTNLNELKVVSSPAARISVDVGPRSKGELVVAPFSPLKDGDTVTLSFSTKDDLLVDSYKLIVGVPKPITAPTGPATSQPLQIFKEDVLAGTATHILGDGFELAFDEGSGLLRRGVAGGDVSLLETPMLHVLPANRPQSPLPDRLAWHLDKMEIKQDGANADVSIKGSYPMFAGGYEISITPNGDMTVESSFKYTGPDFLARETGIRFSMPRECDQLSWNRNAEWSVYPDDHIGRPVGTAEAWPAAQKVGEGIWGHDSSPMGSNEFRSTKRHTNWAWLGYKDGPGIVVVADGKQATRAMMETDRVSMFVSDWYGGTNVGWGEWITNYGRGKQIKNGDVLTSRVTVRLGVKQPKL